MSDAYPYAQQRANARRWLAHMRALAWLGDAYLCAQPINRRSLTHRYIAGRITYG